MTEPTTITKEKIANKLKDHLGLSVSLCEEITTQIFTEIFSLTKANQKISIPNFGTWKINSKKPRVGFNMKTCESVRIDCKKVLRFIPSRSFKEKINK